LEEPKTPAANQTNTQIIKACRYKRTINR